MGAHDHLPAPPVVSPPESDSSASTRQIKLKSSQILRRVETTCEHLAALAEELHSQPPSMGGADPRRAVLSAQYEQLEQQLRQMQAEAAQYELLPDEPPPSLHPPRSPPSPPPREPPLEDSFPRHGSPARVHEELGADFELPPLSLAAHTLPTQPHHHPSHFPPSQPAPTDPSISRNVGVLARVRHLSALLAQAHREVREGKREVGARDAENHALGSALETAEAYGEAMRQAAERAAGARDECAREVEALEARLNEMKAMRDEAKQRAHRAEMREQEEERRHAQQLVSERNDRIREVATVREELCEEQEKHARAVEEGREARELLARGEKERGWLLEAKRAAEWQVEALASELSLTSADMSALCEERAGERGREGSLARLHARVVMQRSLALSFGWWAVRARARERLASKQAIAALRHAWPRVGGCFKRWMESWRGEGRTRRLLRRSADRLGRPRLLACWGRWQRDWELSEVKEVLRAREGWWAQMQEENASLRSSLTREADGRVTPEARARFRQAVDQREGRIRELQAMLEREHAARLRAEERERRQQERAEAYEEELREYEAELDMVSQEADLGIFRARAASPASINSQSPPH